MQFTSPATGEEGPTAADLNGHVLVVEPQSYEIGIRTVHGDKDAIRCRVHDLTTQETHDNALWFGGYLVGALKTRIGERVLALMGKGDARPGQAPPWILTDLSTNERAIIAATTYLSGRSRRGRAAAAPCRGPEAATTLDAALDSLRTRGMYA